MYVLIIKKKGYICIKRGLNPIWKARFKTCLKFVLGWKSRVYGFDELKYNELCELIKFFFRKTVPAPILVGVH